MDQRQSLGRRLAVNYGWPVVIGLLIAIIILQYRQNPNSLLPALLPNAQQSPPAYTTSYADAVELALPSVVNIYISKTVTPTRNPLLNDPLLGRLLERKGLRPPEKTQRTLGSGVIISADGYVLTNNHVINNADSIRVLLTDGRERLAKVIGYDSPTDLAVLKIEMDNLTPATFADPESVRIGDIVLAIGNPWGIGQTVTQGIVSATGRYGLQVSTYEKYIQTDAAINSGNSGGALINARGELIGINSVLSSISGGSNGIGFAIPMDIATYVFENIINEGEVVRGWLGITVEEITPAIAEVFNLNDVRGLVLTNLASAGPAQRAGLRVGDIITHIDDIATGNGNAGMHQVAQTKPGTKINVRALRNGAAQSFLVEVGRRPTENSS